MGIQERLYEQRYGEMGYKLPDRKTMLKTINYNYDAFRKTKQYKRLREKFIYNYMHPPKRGRYFSKYLKTIQDYNSQITKYGDTSLSYIINEMILSTAFFIKNQQMYNYNFKNFSFPLISRSLFMMRNYIIETRSKYEKLYPKARIGTPLSCFQYNFPKPLYGDGSYYLALTMYDDLYYCAMRLVNKS